MFQKLLRRIKGRIMTWDDVEDIAELLEENYPEAEIEELSRAELEEMVRSLDEFADDEGVRNERLDEILDAWHDVRDGI